MALWHQTHSEECFSASHSRINSLFTAGKWIEVWKYHSSGGHRKTTIFELVFSCLRLSRNSRSLMGSVFVSYFIASILPGKYLLHTPGIVMKLSFIPIELISIVGFRGCAKLRYTGQVVFVLKNSSSRKVMQSFLCLPTSVNSKCWSEHRVLCNLKQMNKSALKNKRARKNEWWRNW
jgi:hypothetical protein